MAVYSGFSAAITGLSAAKEVFNERRREYEIANGKVENEKYRVSTS